MSNFSISQDDVSQWEARLVAIPGEIKALTAEAETIRVRLNAAKALGANVSVPLHTVPSRQKRQNGKGNARLIPGTRSTIFAEELARRYPNGVRSADFCDEMRQHPVFAGAHRNEPHTVAYHLRKRGLIERRGNVLYPVTE